MFSTIFRLSEQFHSGALELCIGSIGVRLGEFFAEGIKVTQAEFVKRVGIEMKLISVITKPLGTDECYTVIRFRIVKERFIN